MNRYAAYPLKPQPLAPSKAASRTPLIAALTLTLLALSPPPQTSAQPIAPDNSLPLGVVLVRRYSPVAPRDSIEPTNQHNDPLAIDPHASLDQIEWGLILSSETQRVLVPAHIIQPDRETAYLVSGRNQQSQWSRLHYQPLIVDPWSDWAILEPVFDSNAPSPDFEPAALASPLAPAAPFDAGLVTLGLPSPNAWLSDEQEPKLWSATFETRWQGAGQLSDGAIDDGDRWIDFGGLQSLALPLNAWPGPLFDQQRQCIGWLTPWKPSQPLPMATLLAPDPEQTITGWARPLDQSLLRIWQQLDSGADPAFGFFGIRPRATRQSVRDRGYTGVSVYDVADATPAARIGLAYGDLITHWNGRPVATPETLLWLIAAQAPGSQAQVRWVRGVLTDQPKEHEQAVVISRRPRSARWPIQRAEPQPLDRLLLVDWGTAAPDFSQASDHLPAAAGVWIDQASSSLSLEFPPIKSGVWIVKVDDQTPASPDEFWDLIQAGRTTIRLAVWSQGGAEPETLEVPRERLLQAPGENH